MKNVPGTRSCGVTIAVWCALSTASTAVAQPPPDDIQAADVDTEDAQTETSTLSEAARREASARFRSGVALFEEQDYEGAVVEFERAFEAAPNPVVLYNLAQSYLALRDYVAARERLVHYLEWPEAAISEERREAVREQIDMLGGRIGALRVVVNVDGAQIVVDDVERGVSPLSEPVLVSTGRHQILVRAQGHEPARRTVSVAGGTETEVELALRETTSPVMVVRAEEPEHPLRTTGQVLFGVGLAAGAAAVTGLVFTLNARSDYNRAADRLPADLEAATSARRRFDRAALATDILTGAAVALGVTGITLWVVDGRRTTDSADDASGRVESVALSITPMSFSLSGDF